MASSDSDSTTCLGWSDELSAELSQQATASLRAHVIYCDGEAYEIALEGECPRCHHVMVSSHVARGVTIPGSPVESADASSRSRLITTECCCSHRHGGAPSNTRGCGAAFALRVSFDHISSGPGSESAPRCATAQLTARSAATLLGLEQERAMQVAQQTELADVRSQAGNWRTGLGALITVLTVVLFVQGKKSFDDLPHQWLRWILAALLIASASAAIYGAYRAVRAAYGLPSDEHTGSEGSPLMASVERLKEHLPRWLTTKTPGDPAGYATVGAWRHAFARLAVNDLRQAKVATIVSLIAFLCAAIVTWIG